ncbi:quinol-cytochrome oxidoreductase complex cytochrome b subunit [Natronobacillus azotifigens]|uniref:Uncharacterized protein n=1 Tax=Natronobacillus azotifigens TaxID=472978 RepID=A0A9J6R8K8_9BACI|nr:hypothetical protein [Natronobacillus azotifigens]MCZ0701994.1 hypothetical protein [Natronobacillus azotifigens]
MNILFALNGPGILFILMYNDIKKGKKLVDLSIVVVAFYFGGLGYQIASENRSTDELLAFLIVLSIVYGITFFVLQMIISRHNEKIKEKHGRN